MGSWRRRAFVMIGACFLSITPAFAKDDRVSFASDITVKQGSTADDLVCLMCSVRVHGDVHGDVVTLLGSVSVDDAHSIAGDVATVGGDVSLGDNASVNGDLVVTAGYLNKGSGATIGGESKVMAGRGWLLIPFAPLLILIGIVWLIVWLFTRRRPRFPTYPQGRRF